MKAVEFIKEHPYGSAIIVFAIGLLFVMLRGGGGAAQPANVVQLGPDAAQVQAGTQLQLAQIQASAQGHTVDQQAAVASQQLAAQVTLGTLQAQVTDNNNNLQAQVAEMLAQTQSQTQIQISSLQAQVADNQTKAQEQEAEAAIAGQVSIASLPYQLQIAQVNAQRDIAVADINTQASANLQAIQLIQNQLTGIANFDTSAAGQIDKLTSGQQTLLDQVKAIQSFDTNISGAVSTLQTQAKTLTAQQTQTAAQLKALQDATGTAIADLNAWSNRYEGGTIAPNISLFSGYHGSASTWQAGYTNA